MATATSTALGIGAVRKVPQSKLGVSEPDPWMFGNPENERSEAWNNDNWLKSRFHFSFAEYHNPANQDFGVLRVMNDDLVQPHRGFGEHPHRDMEICTYVVEGALSHQDSMGTSETIGRGSIQFMSAGSGVRHSEHNLSDRPLRFIQIWINTRTRGLRPNYGSAAGDAGARRNKWAHLVSDVKSPAATAVKINQDANILVAELTAPAAPSSSSGAAAAAGEGDGAGEGGEEGVPLVVQRGRQAYLLCMEGNATITEEAEAATVVDAVGGATAAAAVGTPAGAAAAAVVRLNQHDAAEIQGPVSLRVAGGCHLLLVEMRLQKGSGRRDLSR